MKRSSKMIRRAALLTWTSASALHAQAASDTTKKRTLEPVVVTEKAAARPSEITLQGGGLPTPVSVIGHAQLERTNFGRDFGTLLRRVPGIMTHNIGQGDTGDSEKMRGFLSSTHGADVAVLIDGVPQNLPSASINHGMNDMSWLTADMIERIEVIKGPFSALFGDQARSGAINIVTRSSAESSVRGTYGSFGTRRGALVLSGQNDVVRGLVVADKFNVDGYRANSDENRATVFAKGIVTRGGADWAARGVHYHSKWSAPGFLDFKGLVNGALRPTDADPTAPPLWGDGDRTSLVLTRKPSAGEPGLYLSASTEQYKRNRALGANKTDYNIQADDRRILTARVMENYVVADMGAVALGVEARRDRGDATNRRWPGGTPGPNYTWNQDLNLRTYGAFAQGQYKPIASLKLIGGARVDRLDYDIANRKLPAASVTYHKSVATPRGGVVWTPLGSLDLFANIGQGYRSPNQTEISPSGSLGPLGASGGTPYPDLAPPKVTSKDAGATLYGSTWRLTGARYHTLNESEIIQVSPGVFSTVGNTIRDGWEVEATMTPTGTIDAYASYGRIMQARILSAAAGQADRVPVPRDTWKGGLGYHAPFGVMLDVDASYISRVPYFAGSPLTLVYTRQYTRFDARATRGVGQLDVTAFATAQPVEYGAEAASAVSAGLLIDPRPKSELGVSVRYRFGRY